MSNSLRPHGLYSPWDSPGQNTGVGGLSLLQGIEPRSLSLEMDSLPAEPQGKPKTLEWVAFPFSSGSFFFFLIVFIYLFILLVVNFVIHWNEKALGSHVLKIWNASRICVSSLRRGHANLLCIVPILVYVLPKRAHPADLFDPGIKSGSPASQIFYQLSYQGSL